MSSNQNLLMGALIAAVCFLALSGSHSATASMGGPFQLMHHSNTGANAGVFRLDTASGEVSYCYLPNNQADVICSHGVK